MASFTLDDIRSAAEAKYGDTTIDLGDATVTMINPLRLKKEKRKALEDLQSSLDSDEEVDQEAVIQDIIRTVSTGPVEELLDAVGDDLATLAQLLETYSKETQAGEASASAA